jgi:hypothetical protein
MTAAAFLADRRDFLHVYATRSVSGKGWDVALRVDGTYTDRADAEGAAVGIRDWLGELVDLPRDRRDWWDGPPWRRPRATSPCAVPMKRVPNPRGVGQAVGVWERFPQAPTEANLCSLLTTKEQP